MGPIGRTGHMTDMLLSQLPDNISHYVLKILFTNEPSNSDTRARLFHRLLLTAKWLEPAVQRRVLFHFWVRLGTVTGYDTYCYVHLPSASSPIYVNLFLSLFPREPLEKLENWLREVKQRRNCEHCDFKSTLMRTERISDMDSKYIYYKPCYRKDLLCLYSQEQVTYYKKTLIDDTPMIEDGDIFGFLHQELALAVNLCCWPEQPQAISKVLYLGVHPKGISVWEEHVEEC